MSAQLIKYEAARQALEEAKNVDEAKGIRDKALALQAYARQAKDNALIDWATEIRLRAERKVGILLKAMAERGERVQNGRPDLRDGKPRLSDLGVSKMQSLRWRRLADIPFDEFERRIEAAKYDIKRAADGVEREPKCAAPKDEKHFASSIFDKLKLRNKEALGELRWSQLDRLITDNAFELELLRLIRDAGVPADRNARLREILTADEVAELVPRALEKSQ